MTATATFPDGNYETEGFTLTDTVETTVYTVPAGFGGGLMLVEIMAADEDGTANTLTVKVSINGVEYTLANTQAIAASTPLQKNFTGLVLAENDTIKLTAGSATIDGYVTVLKVSRVA